MTTELDRLSEPRALAANVTQATAVEQARAVAEVQAAVVVAQNVPRDRAAAEAEMRDSCQRKSLADRAFYSVPNRGTGPTVHLARELARIWGNIQYGVHELRRDDAAGMSEVQAFAWDVQTNTRSTRTFQVPHERMARKQRQKLVDLGDIYLNNQNVGARAVRECIFTVLPPWFSEDAQAICQRTLSGGGENQSTADQVAAMVKAFRDLGVTEAMLEARLGKKRGQWGPGEIAQARVIHSEVSRGEVRVEDAFEDESTATKGVTADDIKADQ
jgi:hypothetical protein